MFRDKRVNHSFHYFLWIRPFFILKSDGNLMGMFFQAAIGRGCWRPSPYSVLHHKDSSSPQFWPLPKYTQESSFTSVQEAGCQGSDTSTGTLKQQDYGQQTLKMENGGRSKAREADEAPAASPFQAQGALAAAVTSRGTWLSGDGSTFCFLFAACSWTRPSESPCPH